MNSRKAFTVVILKPADAAHARKLAEILRQSFPYRGAPAANHDWSSGFSIMVIADDAPSVHAALSAAVGTARVVIAEMSWLADGGQMSSEPPQFLQFTPPEQATKV